MFLSLSLKKFRTVNQKTPTFVLTSSLYSILFDSQVLRADTYMFQEMWFKTGQRLLKYEVSCMLTCTWLLMT